MDTKRLTLDTTMTLIAAYLGRFVGLIDANAGITVGVAVLGSAMASVGGAGGVRVATVTGGLVRVIGAAAAFR